MKLGSLFDGSGGFPLAGVLHGVEPVWASEIEPYPIRVTKARFPQMKHLGSVLDVNGAEVEPVDIITFGSPCQDLSVAGKQAGLHKGERSNLFFEAIRIIKEMREATNGVYPRIAVWENVPGAYSSNKGEDFRAVLQAFCTVKDEAADVPRPATGKWNPAGAIVGNGWSVAWRTFDAQYWGVPQRRRRIYLIADFGSERAGEVLFEQEGLRGHSAESGTAGEGTADNAEGSVGRGCKCLTPDDVQSRRVYTEDGIWPSLYGGEGGGHGYVLRQSASGNAEGSVGGGGGAIVFKERAGCPGGGKGILCGDKPFTLSTLTDQAVCYAIDQQGGKGGANYAENITPPILSDSHGTPHGVCYAVRTRNTMANGWGVAENAYTLDTSEGQAVAYSVDCRNMNLTKEHGTLQAKENGGQSLNYMGAVCYAYDQYNGAISEKQAALGVNCGMSTGRNGVCYPINTMVATRWNADDGRTTFGVGENGDPQFTLGAAHEHAVCYPIDSHQQDSRFKVCADGISPTLPGQMGTGGNNGPMVLETFQNTGRGWWNKSDIAQTVRTPCGGDSTKANLVITKTPRKYIIRRLTPLECLRLQGLPDGWLDGVDGSDSAKYKMLGNGIAMPNAIYVVGCAVKLIKEAQT